MGGIVALIGLVSAPIFFISLLGTFFCGITGRKTLAKKWALAIGISAVSFAICVKIDLDQPNGLYVVGLVIFTIFSYFFTIRWKPSPKNLEKNMDTTPTNDISKNVNDTTQTIDDSGDNSDPIDLMQKAIEDDDWEEFDRLQEIEKKKHAEVIASTSGLLKKSSEKDSPFLTKHDLQWGNSPIHNEPEQITRQKRAHDCHMKSLDKKRKTAQFYGSEGIYVTELSFCTCPDFDRRGLPCKHMYRLASELGLMDLPMFEKHETDYTRPHITFKMSKPVNNDFEDFGVSTSDWQLEIEKNKEEFENNVDGYYLDLIKNIISPLMKEGQELDVSERQKFHSVHLKNQPGKVLCRLYCYDSDVYIEPSGYDKSRLVKHGLEENPKITKKVHGRLQKVWKELFMKE